MKMPLMWAGVKSSLLLLLSVKLFACTRRRRRIRFNSHTSSGFASLARCRLLTHSLAVYIYIFLPCMNLWLTWAPALHGIFFITVYLLFLPLFFHLSQDRYMVSISRVRRLPHTYSLYFLSPPSPPAPEYFSSILRNINTCITHKDIYGECVLRCFQKIRDARCNSSVTVALLSASTWNKSYSRTRTKINENEQSNHLFNDIHEHMIISVAN